ncbi:MAG: hypothetical protein HC779_01005 [Phyllobacteriaceae bacterium]|nr:hypothetical protein [Phyllobacteriaceae bacterium]
MAAPAIDRPHHGLEDQPVPDPGAIAARLPDHLRGGDVFAAMTAHADTVCALIDDMIIRPSGLKGKALEAWEETAVKDA